MRLRRAAEMIALGMGAALLLAGCGGAGNNEPAPTATDAPIQAATPLPARTLPPTWTPVPTLTPPPAQPTAAVTRTRPTVTPFVMPTYTPSPEPPTPTPPGPVLTLDAAALASGVQALIGGAAGDLFAASPQFALGEGEVIATMQWYETRGNPASGRPLRLRLALEAVEGRAAVRVIDATFTDTGAAFEAGLLENLRATVEQAVTAQVIAAYGQPGARFGVLAIAVAPDRITVETVAFE